MVELVALVDLSQHSSTQTLSRNDAQAANEGADAQVDEHALLSVAGTTPEGNENAAKDNDTGVGEEARRNDIMLHLLNIGNGTLLWSIQHDNDAANDTQEATNFSNKTQALLQKDGRENGSDDDGQSAEWCYQDGIGEGVGDKIADLSNDH